MHELCAGNLHDLVLGKYTTPLIDINLKDMLCQIVKGLEHLHLLNIVHGDKKPTYILISYPKGALSAQMKLADFGLFHSVGSDESDSGDIQFLSAFTEGWLCPSDPVDEEGNTNYSYSNYYSYLLAQTVGLRVIFSLTGSPGSTKQGYHQTGSSICERQMKS